ncbi:MAG TPA: hypothetical protein VMW50_04665 [Dehalococcoidia bacterium]|nr:hypothetical protein [Dehalococcoidia bacterium]
MNKIDKKLEKLGNEGCKKIIENVNNDSLSNVQYALQIKLLKKIDMCIEKVSNEFMMNTAVKLSNVLDIISNI